MLRIKKASRVMHVELNALYIDIGEKTDLNKFGLQARAGLKPHAKFTR